MKANLTPEQRRIAQFENLEYGHRWELWRDGTLWYRLGWETEWKKAKGLYPSIVLLTKSAKQKGFIRVD